MAANREIPAIDGYVPDLGRRALREQIRWLIMLRWIAVGCIIPAGLICTDVFPVMPSVGPLHYFAGILLVSNILCLLASRSKRGESYLFNLVLAMVQIEVDLIILTGMIHISGGITNPFILFYVFHVIIATIILPKSLSFCVGISTVLLFGLMAMGELHDWPMLGHHPLELTGVGSLYKNPVYVLGSFAAFSAMVVLVQYLTWTVVTRMAAKEMEASRNRDVLEAVISGMAEGLVFVTNDGNVFLNNPEAQKWAKGEKVSVDDFPDKLAGHLRGLIDGSRNQSDDEVIRFYMDGEDKRYIEARTCPVISATGERLGFVVVGQDLTEHKELEQELRRQSEETAEINEMLKMSRVEMAQREKMVAIGQMATGIAHEIGNPLASLSSVVQYLDRQLDDADQKEQVGLIQTQIERISAILKHMLGLSRPATSEYRWTDVNAVIESTLALVRFDRRAKVVEIESVANPDLPMVWLNPLHLEQVLINLVMNALDAMAAHQGKSEHKLTITRLFKDEMVEVSVGDTGVGMSADVCRRAFESFFTTKELGKGTGLGLYISYNLLSEIDGTISLDSEVGVGTTVTIRLPIRPKKDLIVEAKEEV